jgi:transmembrane sensor
MNLSPSHPSPSAEEEAALWAARIDGSTLSASDRAALDAWLAVSPAHRALLTRYCQFSADLEQQLPLIEGIKELSAGTRIARETARPLPWLRRPMMAGAVLTAAAAVAVALWLARPAVQVGNFATPMALRQSVTLADGTQVELNAQTSLHVDIDGTSRRVRLAGGEAFFSVHKDASRPFTVETPAGSVRVTGTRFDVRAETPASLEVTVVEGSVRAHPNHADAPLSLHAGDRLVSSPAGIEVRPLAANDLDDVLAWRHGQIVFNGTPLREALARFARYHGRGIVAGDEVASLPVGGRFSLDDLDGFFAALEEVLPVKVSRNQNGTVQVDRRPAR